MRPYEVFLSLTIVAYTCLYDFRLVHMAGWASGSLGDVIQGRSGCHM